MSVVVLPSQSQKTMAPTSKNITFEETLQEKEKPLIVSELRLGNVVIKFKRILPWIMLTALLCIIILTAYYVITGRRKEEAKETLPETAKALEVQPVEPESEEVVEEEKPEEPPEPSTTVPSASTPLRSPRISKAFYKGIDRKLASISRRLERLGKMNKKLGK